jgi:gas vesicle protein
MRSFLWGIVLGVAAGMLYAPANGKRTRTVMKDKLVELSNNTADRLGNQSRELNTRLQGARENLNRAVDQVKPKINRAANTARGAYQNMRAQLTEANNEITETAEQVQEKKRQSA